MEAIAQGDMAGNKEKRVQPSMSPASMLRVRLGPTWFAWGGTCRKTSDMVGFRIASGFIMA
jgi:hypothetical protein